MVGFGDKPLNKLPMGLDEIWFFGRTHPEWWQLVIGRIIDSHSIINEVFKIVQKQGPVRKSEVIANCPDAEKSFHHWINILKDKHEVITVEESGNFNVYKAVSKNILNKKLKAGELLKDGNIFSVVEF